MEPTTAAVVLSIRREPVRFLVSAGPFPPPPPDPGASNRAERGQTGTLDNPMASPPLTEKYRLAGTAPASGSRGLGGPPMLVAVPRHPRKVESDLFAHHHSAACRLLAGSHQDGGSQHDGADLSRITSTHDRGRQLALPHLDPASYLAFNSLDCAVAQRARLRLAGPPHPLPCGWPRQSVCRPGVLLARVLMLGGAQVHPACGP